MALDPDPTGPTAYDLAAERLGALVVERQLADDLAAALAGLLRYRNDEWGRLAVDVLARHAATRDPATVPASALNSTAAPTAAALVETLPKVGHDG